MAHSQADVSKYARPLRAAAIDIGAESGRVTLAEWDGARAHMRVVHRFLNGPVERDGHLYWDVDLLARGIEEGLRRAAELAPEGIDTLGLDTWGVDYVRLNEKGERLSLPFCYRDPRTETAPAEVWARISPERLYQLTGMQFMRLNTLYQLYADQRDGLPPGALWLQISSYLMCGLGAPPLAEYTNASTTNLVDVHTRNWCDEVFEKVGLDRKAAAPIVFPGVRLGPVKGPLAALPAYRNTQLIATATHDTGAAVAGIPDAGTDWAFISSGTWSLVGMPLEEPCTNDVARREDYTNEGGIAGRIRFLKNVNGMWLIEECLREWRAKGVDWKVADLVAACARQPVPKVTFPVTSPELILPGNMPGRINRELEKAGHAPLPEDGQHAPEMASVIFVSLAARYAEILKGIQEATGQKLRCVYIVGGGSQNEYLNGLIAERSGLKVVRGPVESTTAGNVAVQFAALDCDSPKGATPAAVAEWAARLATAS